MRKARIQTARKVAYRLYQDFFMRSRLEIYRSYLLESLEQSYTFITVEDFARRVRTKQGLPPRCAVLRHDIDSDVDTARHMFEIEQELQVRSTYYFRLSTVQLGLMKEIAEWGSEVSYHFEEIATVAKRRGLKSASEIDQHIDEMRDLFRANLSQLRDETGIPMRTVASHGDFANRYLGIPNHRLLDESLRSSLGIAAEVYDSDLAHAITTRVTDVQPPDYWSPRDPIDAIRGGSPVIYMLVHPSHWRANVAVNSSALATRLSEGVKYWLRRTVTL